MHPLQGTASGAAITALPPWAGVEGLLLPAKMTWQTEGLGGSSFIGICLHSVCLYSNFQDSIFSQ